MGSLSCLYPHKFLKRPKFKGGFANDTADAYLCGAVLDGPRYAALSAADAAGGFFPAYRGRERD
jgi:hypothetical protein